MAAAIHCPPIVYLSCDSTISASDAKAYEGKTVVVIGQLNLSDGTTFKVANLINLGGVSAAGTSVIEVPGTFYVAGLIGWAALTIKAPRMISVFQEGAVEEMQKLCVPIAISNGK